MFEEARSSVAADHCAANLLGTAEARVARNLRAYRARQALRAACFDATAWNVLATELLDDLLAHGRRTHDTERALLLLSVLVCADAVSELVRARLPELIGAAERLFTPLASEQSDGALHALLGLCSKVLRETNGRVDPDDSASAGADADSADFSELHAACARALPPLATLCARLRGFVRAAFGEFLSLYATLPEHAFEASATVLAVACAWMRARAAASDADEREAPAASARRVGDRLCALSAVHALARTPSVLRPTGAAGGVADERAAGRARRALCLVRALALEHAVAGDAPRNGSSGRAEEALFGNAGGEVRGGSGRAEEAFFGNAGGEVRACQLADSMLELTFGDDAALLDLLRSALLLSAAMPVLAPLSGSPPEEARALAIALCPFRLLSRMAAMLGHDPTVVADWLAAPETATRCAAYLVALCRAASAAASTSAPAAGLVQNSSDCSDGERAAGQRVVRFIAQLLAEVERRDVAGVIGYSVAPLLRRIRHAASLDWPFLLSTRHHG